MRTRTVTVLLTGFALALVSLIPTSAQAQSGRQGEQTTEPRSRSAGDADA